MIKDTYKAISHYSSLKKCEIDYTAYGRVHVKLAMSKFTCSFSIELSHNKYQCFYSVVLRVLCFTVCVYCLL